MNGDLKLLKEITCKMVGSTVISHF